MSSLSLNELRGGIGGGGKLGGSLNDSDNSSS